MKIAYRRMSGPIGTSSLETGTRGMWLEKRNALMTLLRRRGHVLDLVNRMTKFSEQIEKPTFGPRSHDLLIVEFGSSNRAFYKDDLAETERMVAQHQGKVVFVCDDPDLPYLWKTVTPKEASRWSVWMNAKRPEAFGGQPAGVASFDVPFAAMMDLPTSASTSSKAALVYIGRPNGRRKAIETVLAAKVPWVICAKAKEWEEFAVDVTDAPKQSERASFYRPYAGCLAIADAKHKRLGWRTGRAYHALRAGVPVVAEADHDVLDWAVPFSDARTLQVAFQTLTNGRAEIWAEQRAKVLQEAKLVDQALQAHGL